MVDPLRCCLRRTPQTWLVADKGMVFLQYLDCRSCKLDKPMDTPPGGSPRADRADQSTRHLVEFFQVLRQLHRGGGPLISQVVNQGEDPLRRRYPSIRFRRLGHQGHGQCS